MSYSDFLILPGNGNVVFPPTGSSILNSSLPNPLTSSVQCRVYDPNLGGVIRGNFYISSSVSSSAFVNIPETKSVSLRIWGRATNFNPCKFALVAKTNPPNNLTNGIISASLPDCGYEFGFRNDLLYCSFGGYKAGRSAENPFLTSLGKTDTWIGLRMDIVPVKVNKIINGTPVSGNLKDVITLYTASLSAPDTWGQVYTTEFLTTNNYYVPWNSFTTTAWANPGPNTLVDTSSYGFAIYGGPYSPNDIVYFDDFQIFVEDAF
jgi:hypothetical protein